MKSYTITVNGNVYDVTVEENGSTGAAFAPRKMAAAPKAAPAAAAPKAAAGAGNVKIEAKAAGKVFKIEANPGTSVKKGDTVLILEVIHTHAFDIPKLCHCHNSSLIRDQILHGHIIFIKADRSLSVISVFAGYYQNLLPDYAKKFLFVSQNCF